MKERTYILRIAIAAVLMAAAFLIHDDHETASFVIYAAAYVIVGIDVIYAAARNITRGQIFDENFLMTVATLGAFAIGEYPEGVLVMLLYQIGELFQRRAVDRSKRSIADMMKIQPEYANLEMNGIMKKVSPRDVSIGDTIVVKPGERIPLDGIVVHGSTMLDTSALTGESVPRSVNVGDEVMSGTINLNGSIRITVGSAYKDSTVNRIMEMVEHAGIRKSHSEQFITRFARVYTPVVVFAAVIIASIPPLLFGQELNEWVYRALSFLVVSCPCALVISVPLTFFGGIGGASRNGILVKGGNYLEALANAEIAIFDKTGTLTKGTFEVTNVMALNMDQHELLKMAAYAESHSTHPIAESIRKAYGNVDTSMVTDVIEIPGKGVRANVSGRTVTVGNARLIDHVVQDDDIADTVVHVTVDGVYEGYITIADEIKEDAWDIVKGLNDAGVKRTVMLTGDTDDVGKRVAASLGFSEVRTEMLPIDKVNVTESLMTQTSRKGRVLFVGDGVNDAPVIARSDIGIAMGGIGSDAAIEAADVVMMTDEPSKVATAVKISKRTVSIAKQNIVLSIAVKLIVMALVLVGVASMWEAIFADVGIMIVCVLNAMRTLRMHPIQTKTAATA